MTYGLVYALCEQAGGFDENHTRDCIGFLRFLMTSLFMVFLSFFLDRSNRKPSLDQFPTQNHSAENISNRLRLGNCFWFHLSPFLCTQKIFRLTCFLDHAMIFALSSADAFVHVIVSYQVFLEIWTCD